ncbi:MAG: hypothetical protein KDN19_10575 [Verrucomicrobiae bacterium]|nr:hypothetical protein [Verrucomicrobiae bacterium]
MKPAPLFLLFLAAVATVATADDSLPVAELKREEPVNFATEIYPFLKANCLACHNSTKAKADLILESPQDMIKGGESGPAIDPGKGELSFLFSTAAHIEEPTMPPANNKSKAKDLTPEQLALLKLWIDQGAKGDAVATEAPTSWTMLSGPQPIYTAAISDDGRYAAAGRGQQIHIYDLRLKKLVASLKDPAIKEGAAHLDLVHSIAFSPDGTLASGGYRTAKIWKREDAKAGSAVALPNEPGIVAVSPDGKRAAIGASDGAILMMALDQPEAPPVTIKDHAGAVTGMAFSADGKTLFSVSTDKTVKSRPLSDPTKVSSLALPAPANGVALINGGKHLVIAGADQNLRLCATDLKSALAFTPPPPPKPAPPAPPKETPAPKPAAETKPATPAPASPAPVANATPAPKEEAKPETKPAAPAAATTPPPKPEPKPEPPKPKTLVEFKPHGQPVVAVASASNDGTEFLAGYADGTVIQFKIDPAKPGDAPKEIRRLAHGAPLTQLSVALNAPAGPRVATAGATGSLNLWNLADGAKVAELKGDPAIAPRIEGLQRDSTVAARLKSHWEKQGPEAEKLWKDESEKAKSAGETIAKARRDIVAKRAARDALIAKTPAAKEEDIAKAREDLVAAERALSGAIRNRDLSARLAGDAFAKQTSAQSAAQEADSLAAALKTEIEALQKTIPEAEKAIASTAIAFSTDGATLAQALKDGTIRLRSTSDGAWLEDFAAGGAVKAMAFDRSNRLLTAREGKNLLTWELPGHQWTLAKTLGDGKTPDPFVDRVTALAFSPDGDQLVTGSGVPSRSGGIIVWDTESWSILARDDKAHEDTITSFAFSPDGDRFASGSTDRLIKVFEAGTLDPIQTFEGHTSHVLDVAWNPDGLTLASAGADLQVKVWDIAENQESSKVEGFGKEVGTVAYLGGTDTLLTASGDKTLKLANQPLPETGDTFLHTAAASADGKLIIAGGQDSVLRLWDATGKKLIQSFPSPEADPSKVASE